VTRLGAEDSRNRGSISWQGQEVFVFSKATSADLVLTQAPAQ